MSLNCGHQLFIPQVIYEHGKPWWNDIDRRKTPDLSTRALEHSYEQSHLVAKQEELVKEMMNVAILSISVHTSKGFITCRKIL
jgi:hypothetical protein